ncbi:T-complex protein 1 subunit delta [Saprolegnia parasitica CBS 223.65]|uniref:T-complex protein 1 subunit delta n=1 Tax=Saprolegnia parasitica (strain CBS 223.65) TaxID=695850 RepID=A0A067CCA2_SAPPC|nr:T-complex protein 1 subunit delta [Saprolegnia parasitica CBS 223.65]KDO26795.1 T-complex protein 1 subunit delta [Saprolegnia parasitica CBS 223.65]|eukprot:XP_012202443.1 T-complex protein 1 subunit delta [Saprolegnia parasitica CBS 223.65]
MATTTASVQKTSAKGETLRGKAKEKDVRMSNIIAAKAIANAIRTSLGPRGMDKMIQQGNGEVIISNDGATILTQMQVYHPTAKMLVDLSKSQDIEAGDGTTSVCVIAGALLSACEDLLQKGIHPSHISEAFGIAATKADEILMAMSRPVDLANRDELIKCVTTSLSSKVISEYSDRLSPIAVDAVLNVIDIATAVNVDLRDVKVVKQLGGTIDDSQLINGLVFSKSSGVDMPTTIANAKIALIQFCLSAPKTDMENNVVINDYSAMDRILREERKFILNLCKQIKKAGVNVLLIQKSILRDATSDLSLHFLAKMGIHVITDIERTDVEYISTTLGCLPVAHIESLTAEKLGTAGLVQEESLGGHKVVKITEVVHPGKTMSILVRGSNKLVLEEAERSLHDALCVVRSLVKKRFLICGGGAPEIEVALRLGEYGRTLEGTAAYCLQAFADALEVIPYTLAENAGLHPIGMVTELRAKHAAGDKAAGINVRKGTISNMYELNILQPLLVNTSEISLASECVRMILKIDDIVMVR